MRHAEGGCPAATGIQARFLLVLAVLLIVSMSLLGVAMYANQRHAMYQRLATDSSEMLRAVSDKGANSCAFLARIAPQAIYAHDYLLLEGYAEELSADPDVVYAVIFGTNGQPLTHHLSRGNTYFEDRSISLEPRNYPETLAMLRTDLSLVHVERPIEHNGMRLGTAEIGLSTAKITARSQQLETNLQRQLQRIMLITAGVICVSLVALIVLIKWVFRRMVVTPIRTLAGHMARLQAGDRNARAPESKRDEIGLLAHTFNRMADELQLQLQHIEEQGRAYKETHDYLANVLENSADMIATTALDGSIVEFNAAAERILGYARDAVVGNSSQQVFQDATLRQHLYQAVYAGRAVRNAEARLLRRDGTPIDAELTLSPLRDNDGSIIGTICIGRDVTDAKAMRQELIQAEKMASIGQVAAWIAHQIRNYLGRMLMASGCLRPAAGADLECHRAHQDLTKAVKDMDWLVSDLLEFSRTLSLHPTAIRLNAAVEELLSALERDPAHAGVRIQRRLDAGLPLVRADVFKLEQAIFNLLKNAVQAMPDGGVLEVDTSTDAETGQVQLSIRDSGKGIRSVDLPNVFKPFFTTKANGTGLGLAMAARIVEAHGGSITVHSEEGHGARFRILLPVMPAQERSA